MKKYLKTKVHTLDDIDKNIIMNLQNNARQNYNALGKIVGASEGTIRNRVKFAVNREVIQIKAVLNPTKIGFEFTCMLGIAVDIEKLLEVAEKLADYPNVYFLTLCTGTFDIIAMLLFRNSSEFNTFMMEQVSKLPGIRSTQTFVNMNLMKTPWTSNIEIMKLL
ncbi:MAG: Lrp/AsnC family transcriptional regulator [Dehalococcoidales bacterium]|nr:Lrp/AsnC family transcriptional regulator [Dehalococcoidales bacterium]